MKEWKRQERRAISCICDRSTSFQSLDHLYRDLCHLNSYVIKKMLERFSFCLMGCHDDNFCWSQGTSKYLHVLVDGGNVWKSYMCSANKYLNTNIKTKFYIDTETATHPQIMTPDAEHIHKQTLGQWVGQRQ